MNKELKTYNLYSVNHTGKFTSEGIVNAFGKTPIPLHVYATNGKDAIKEALYLICSQRRQGYCMWMLVGDLSSIDPFVRYFADKVMMIEEGDDEIFGKTATIKTKALISRMEIAVADNNDDDAEMKTYKLYSKGREPCLAKDIKAKDDNEAKRKTYAIAKKEINKMYSSWILEFNDKPIAKYAVYIVPEPLDNKPMAALHARAVGYKHLYI